MPSTPRWRVPHFEKMLYTQALLSQALIQAYRMTGHQRYARAARQTIDHVIRDMQQPDGGFATAFDAESKTADGKKEEGAFFVWTPDQLKKALSAADAELAAKVFGITKDGNFHGKKHPPPCRSAGQDRHGNRHHAGPSSTPAWTRSAPRSTAFAPSDRRRCATTRS